MHASGLRSAPAGHFALRIRAADTTDLSMLPHSEGGGTHADLVSVHESAMHVARQHPGPMVLARGVAQ